jgi:radical S-adenosyl methionine domain-containing protein 2
MSLLTNTSTLDLTSEFVRELTIPESVNYHITDRCNYRCSFCFAKYAKNALPLSLTQSKRLIYLLHEKDCKKINFAGGEPTLIHHLPELINYAKELGFFVSLISNGTGISRKFLETCGNSMDLLGLSVDSQYDEIEFRLGRTLKRCVTSYSHVDMIKQKAKLITSFEIPLKINTTVTALNYQEDMNNFIEVLNPIRWKVFQVLRVKNTNDSFFQNRGGITSEQFAEFIARHRNHNPIFESSQIMQDSYFMITPEGRIYANSENGYEYSKSVIDNESELNMMTTKFNQESFMTRGGMYYRQLKM